MKKPLAVRLLSLWLTGALLVLSLTVPAAAAAGDAAFTVDSKSASPGDTVTLAVRCQINTPISGLQLSVTFDKTRLQYVVGSGTCPVAALAGYSLFYDSSKDTVNFAWDTEGTVQPGTAVLLQLQFRVLDTAASGSAAVGAQVKDLYVTQVAGGSMTTTDIPATVSAGGVNIGAASAQVKAVIDAINAIGTVTYTPACRAKIDAAFALYGKLSYLERQQVANYAQLVKADDDYRRLADKTEQDKVNAEVSAYRQKHKTVLALNILTVRLENKAAVAKAVEEYGKLSIAAQAALNNDRGLLTVLTRQLEKLQAAADEEEAAKQEAERLRKEAEELAAAFRKTYAVILKLTEKTVTIDHKTGVSQALLEIESMQLVNPIAYEMLNGEQGLLDRLLKQIEQLEIAENPELEEHIVAANRFRQTFGWILGQTAGTITKDDLIEIRLAQEFAKLLPEKTQELLKPELALLQTLRTRAEQLASAGGATVVPTPVPTVPQPGPLPPAVLPDPEPLPGGDPTDSEEPGSDPTAPSVAPQIQKVIEKETVVQRVSRAMTPAVWVLLILLVVSTAVLVTLRIVYSKKNGGSDPHGQGGNRQ